MDQDKEVENNLEKKKVNTFKNPEFYKGFCGSIVLFLFLGIISSGRVIIAYWVLSIVVWSFVSNNNRHFALGILLAGFMPILLFIMIILSIVLEILLY